MILRLELDFDSCWSVILILYPIYDFLLLFDSSSSSMLLFSSDLSLPIDLSSFVNSLLSADTPFSTYSVLIADFSLPIDYSFPIDPLISIHSSLSADSSVSQENFFIFSVYSTYFISFAV